MSSLRKNLIAFIVLGVLSSLAIQSYFGEHGLQARSALKARIGGLDKKMQFLQEKKRELERMNKRLAPGSVDRDMLEFQARELLNFVYEKERVYVRETK